MPGHFKSKPRGLLARSHAFAAITHAGKWIPVSRQDERHDEG